MSDSYSSATPPSSPINAPKDAQDARTTNAAAPILIIEDNEDSMALISYVLQNILGYSIMAASSGRMALSLLEEQKPRLILTDIMLPDMDGFELIQAFQQKPELATVPVVAVTALAQSDEQERIESAGFSGYLAKPFLIQDVESVIQRHI